MAVVGENDGAKVSDGAVFPASTRKALSLFGGGCFLIAIGALVVAWRLGEFTIDGSKPTLFITVAAGFVGLLGPFLIVLGVLRIVRKPRLVLGVDRLQVVETRGGAEVVVAQVMYKNVRKLVAMKTETGKQLDVQLYEQTAAGTFAGGNTIRGTDSESAAFVIEDQYQGKFEAVVDAVNAAVAAWWKDHRPG